MIYIMYNTFNIKPKPTVLLKGIMTKQFRIKKNFHEIFSILMGIKNLMKLLQAEAAKSYKETQFQSYFGRSVAIDASMTLYQFLVSKYTF